jgi:Fic family protein
MKPHPDIAFNTLPPLPPAGLLFDNPDLLKKSMSVSSAISELNAMLSIDDSNIWHSLNMMEPLYVPEAVTSSKVENIVTTNEKVYEARLLEEDEIAPQAKEVMRYTDALTFGSLILFKKKYLATNDYIAIQKVLEPIKIGIRKLPGTHLKNPITNKVYYTPPEGEKVIRDLLKNFEDYFNAEAPAHEVFIRAAILHYQFEAIHPFYDGNGRTGRILIPLYLFNQKLLRIPLLFVSKYILNNRDTYYGLLRGVTFESDWKSWIMYMLDAFEKQAGYTVQVLTKIRRLNEELTTKLDAVIGHAYARDTARFLYEHPYFTQAEFEQAIAVSYVTSRKYLNTLIKNGTITRKKQQNRNRFLYACPEYIALLRKS